MAGEFISSEFACPYGGGMMGYGGGMMGSGWGYIGIIFTILFWAAIILVIVWLYKQIRGTEPAASSKSALDILKERYAKGEITKEEFGEMKKELEK
jgi:putative membrane protein